MEATMKTTLSTLATFALLLVTCWSALSCTDAGKCTRGEPGCACTTAGTCVGGATCNTERMCIERGAPAPEPDGGPPPVTNVDCVDDTFEHACTALCEAICGTQERLCVGSSCGPDDCGTSACTDACGTDPTCLRRACEALKDAECETFGEPNNKGVFVSFCFDSDPVCVPDPDFGCSDICGVSSNMSDGTLAGNHICQDGGEGSTGTTRCARGTDCTDCGKRTCSAPLDTCDSNGDCCGFGKREAYCVQDTNQCLATCSDDNPCTNGEICTPLSAGGDAVCVP